MEFDDMLKILCYYLSYNLSVVPATLVLSFLTLVMEDAKLSMLILITLKPLTH